MKRGDTVYSARVTSMIAGVPMITVGEAIVTGCGVAEVVIEVPPSSSVTCFGRLRFGRHEAEQLLASTRGEALAQLHARCDRRIAKLREELKQALDERDCVLAEIAGG